jgi:hypothetical protein
MEYSSYHEILFSRQTGLDSNITIKPANKVYGHSKKIEKDATQRYDPF